MDKEDKEIVKGIKKETLLKASEISIILDTYDDIFSDFDPRPYSERALSDDFLIEANKASRDKASGQIELIFLIPQKMRNIESENLIKSSNLKKNLKLKISFSRKKANSRKNIF